jgi:hypothetical protein
MEQSHSKGAPGGDAHRGTQTTVQPGQPQPSVPPDAGSIKRGPPLIGEEPDTALSEGAQTTTIQDTQPAPVRVMTPDQHEAYQHNLQLRDTHIRRLQKRQLQAARFGDSADPSIDMKIEDIQHKLSELDSKIAEYTSNITVRPDRKHILSVEQQREAVLELSRITGLPPDKIKLVDIVVGSVVLLVDMPLAGAARLVAMQRLNHPMLRAQGFANVALDRVVDTQGRPLDSMFERAVLFEQAELNDSTPPSAEASPYASVDAEARLRITLADEAVRQD